MKMFIRSQADDLQKLPSAVSRWHLPILDRLALEAALANLEATGNAVFAVRTFVLATKLGVYPPQRIMQWLSQSFESWSDEQGELSMDKAMGLVGGRGKRAAAFRQERDEEVMSEMDLLMGMGAEREEAAEMVESRLDQEDWNKSRHDMCDLKAETLIKRHVARKLNVQRMRKIVDEMKVDPEWQEWARARLCRYNSLSIPPALKSMV